jgi:multiple antibiotic resistance protein
MKVEHWADESRTLTVYWHVYNPACDYKPDRGAARLSQVAGRERCCGTPPGREEGVRLCVVSEPLLSDLWTLILRLFGIPLAMVRIVGGIILVKIGFELFSPSSSGGIVSGAAAKEDANIAFVPLAMPLMCGPGAIATILGMTSTIRQSATELASFVAVVAAIVVTMLVTYLCLIYAEKLSHKLGAMGIDAVTRIVGFFVSAIGVALIFDGVIEALESHGVTNLH